MTAYLGIDIGGTKIAAAVFAADGTLLYERYDATPTHYEAFLELCCLQAAQATDATGEALTYGVCSAGAIDREHGAILSENIRYLNGKPVRDDLSRVLGGAVRLENDMNCATLAEAIDGAGRGYDIVQCLTLSTGVGSGLVVHGRIIAGANGLAGEIGHVPLPFREETDAPLHPCICGQNDCIEKAICGAGLMRLYQAMTGQQAEPPVIASLAQQGNSEALGVLDRYYHQVAKALVATLHIIDPDVIVLMGGLSRLPRLCDEVQARWGQYCLVKEPKTRLVLAAHGSMAGTRGAAFLWRS